MKLKIGDLVTCASHAVVPGWPRNERVGIVFEAVMEWGYWVNIHFGSFTFWLRDDEYNENNLKLLSEK